MIVRHIQPNPESEVQISIENIIRGQVKEGSFVAIQLPRWPPFSSGSTPGILLCLSALLGVPYAGGELAPRGTCPTLVLYLVKINKPPMKVSPRYELTKGEQSCGYGAPYCNRKKTTPTKVLPIWMKIRLHFEDRIFVSEILF